jgi:tRNA A-37 threonylcarbamoyl transferase component Bud32
VDRATPSRIEDDAPSAQYTARDSEGAKPSRSPMPAVHFDPRFERPARPSPNKLSYSSVTPATVVGSPPLSALSRGPTTRELDIVVKASAMASSMQGDSGFTPGSVIAGRYRVLRQLGVGGMGVVLLAEHVIIEKRVALKVLANEFAHKPDLVTRFLREAKAASKIGHENIVDITDFGQTASGNVFFAMEYLDGEDLGKTIQRVKRLPVDRAIGIVLQICRALAAAHVKGIIHRDLKPENVFLIDRDGHRDFVKILDFGVAQISGLDSEAGNRLTRTGMIIGTPEYMSPEQAQGHRPDHRVDIYALGCMLYELVCGEVPFTADTFMGVLSKHMLELPRPPRSLCPELPVALESTILKALEKDRDRRFQSMAELSAALAGVVGSQNPTQGEGKPTAVMTVSGGALPQALEALGRSSTADGPPPPVVNPAAARRTGVLPAAESAGVEGAKRTASLAIQSGRFSRLGMANSSDGGVPGAPLLTAGQAAVGDGEAADGERTHWGWHLLLGLVVAAGTALVVWLLTARYGNTAHRGPSLIGGGGVTATGAGGSKVSDPSDPSPGPALGTGAPVQAPPTPSADTVGGANPKAPAAPSGAGSVAAVQGGPVAPPLGDPASAAPGSDRKVAAAAIEVPAAVTPRRGPKGGRTVPGSIKATEGGRRVTLSITSDPSGAEVMQAARLIGTTPLRWQLDRADEPVQLVVRKESYEDAFISVKPGRSQSVHALLNRKASAAPPAPK